MPTDAQIWEQRSLGRRRLAALFNTTEWKVRTAIDREEQRRGGPGGEQEDDAGDETPIAAERPPYEVRADGRIYVNWQNRTIVSDLGEFGSVVFSFDRHAAMRRRYADSWENSRETIPEIARDFDLPAAAFDRYRALHTWTHASDPFTDEEWAEGLTPEQAVAATLESHRRAYHKKLQKESWSATIADADRWRRFDHTALRPMLESIQAHAPAYVPPIVAIAPAGRPFDLVFCAPDLHYGKDGWADEVGVGYSREQARSLLVEKTNRILSMVANYGRPARIVTAVGNDWFHIDNDQATTTSGTPQDLDGTPHQVLWEGSELAIAQLDMLRQVAPIDVFYVAGNHDRTLGWGLLHSVYAWYHAAADVTIHRSAKPRQYATSGETLIGFTHGDGAKFADLPMLMATEAPASWGATKHRAMFTGHLHYEKTVDKFGVVVYQMPSLSGADRWHARNGYLGARRGLAAYIVDAAEGVIGTIMAPVLEG